MRSFSKILLFAIVLGAFCTSSPAQTKDDARLFYAYFRDSIRYKVDISAYLCLIRTSFYDYYGESLLDQEGLILGANYIYNRDRDYANQSSNYDLRPEYLHGRNNVFYLSQPSRVPGGSRKAMKTAMREAVRNMRNRMYLETTVEADKARMKRLLKDFRLKATVVPEFYQEIDKKYGGDVDAYVDYLFANSMMTDKAKWKSYVKRPTVAKLKKDAAYQYTRSISRYRAAILIQNIDSIPH